MKTLPATLTLTAAMLTLGGCMKWESTNSDHEIARAWAPSEFFPPAPESVDHSKADPGPRTPTLDRSEWPLTTIVAHSTQPQHQPIYTRNVLVDDGIPRNAGKYPTVSSSLDSPTTLSSDAQVGEALLAPLAAAADIILFPIRVFRTGMWKTIDNGLEPYERESGSSWQRAAKAGLLEQPKAPESAK